MYRIFGVVSNLDDVVDAVKKGGKLNVNLNIDKREVWSFCGDFPSPAYVISVSGVMGNSVKAHGKKYPKLENFNLALQNIKIYNNECCTYLETQEKAIAYGEKLLNEGISVTLNDKIICQFKEGYESELEKHLREYHEVKSSSDSISSKDESK